MNDLFSSEDAWDAFIGGILISGFSNLPRVSNALKKNGVDYNTGLTDSEQRLADRIYAQNVEQAAQNENTANFFEKNTLFDDAVEQVKNLREDPKKWAAEVAAVEKNGLQQPAQSFTGQSGKIWNTKQAQLLAAIPDESLQGAMDKFGKQETTFDFIDLQDDIKAQKAWIKAGLTQTEDGVHYVKWDAIHDEYIRRQSLKVTPVSGMGTAVQQPATAEISVTQRPETAEVYSPALAEYVAWAKQMYESGGMTQESYEAVLEMARQRSSSAAAPAVPTATSDAQEDRIATAAAEPRNDTAETVSALMMEHQTEDVSDSDTMEQADSGTEPVYPAPSGAGKVRLDNPLVRCTQEQWDMAKRIAEVTGREIVLFDKPAAENGIEDGYESGGILYINVNSPDPMASIFGHEFCHSFEGTKEHEKLKQFVLNRIEQSGGNLRQMRQEKRDIYKQNGVKFAYNPEGRQKVDNELVAAYVGRNLFTNEQSIRDMVDYDPSLGQRFVRWIDRIRGAFGNNAAAERAFLHRTKQLLQKALNNRTTAAKTKPSAGAAVDMATTTDFEGAREQLRSEYAVGRIDDATYESELALLDEEELRQSGSADVKSKKKTAVPADSNTETTDNGVNRSYSRKKEGRLDSADIIHEEMTEIERYEALKDKSIRVVVDELSADYAKDITRIEALPARAKSKVEKVIRPLAQKLGILGRNMRTHDVEIDFQFSANGGLAESIHKQLRYGGSYADFAKALINLDRVLETATLIEMHTDKYVGTTRANENLEMVYVLFGAFRDGDYLVPVQMEIKKSSDVGGRLYLTVAMTKIEADVMGRTPENNVRTFSLMPASTYNLADIFEKINPSDKHFLKYLPDEFLSDEQIQAKTDAINEDTARIAKYPKVSNQSRSNKDNPATDGKKRTINHSYSPVSSAEQVEEQSEDAPAKVELTRENIPSKAKSYLEKAENDLRRSVEKALSVPKGVSRESLKPIVQQISDEYLRTGKVSQETVDRLFNEAYERGVVEDREYYDQYKHIKDHLRTTAVTLSEQDQSDIPDFNDFRKRASGLLQIKNEGGLPVDSAYQELQNMAPELFPEDITPFLGDIITYCLNDIAFFREGAKTMRINTCFGVFLKNALTVPEFSQWVIDRFAQDFRLHRFEYRSLNIAGRRRH